MNDSLITSLPTNVADLIQKERTELAVNCYDKHPVTFWEYVGALLVLEQDGIVGKDAAKKKSGWAVNKALAFLFFRSAPVTAGKVAEALGYAGYGGANLRLGDDFGHSLREKLGHLTQPPYDQNSPYDVNLCAFLEFVANEGEGALFILRSRFRAALSRCFGEKEIKNWLDAPKPNY